MKKILITCLIFLAYSCGLSYGQDIKKSINSGIQQIRYQNALKLAKQYQTDIVVFVGVDPLPVKPSIFAVRWDEFPNGASGQVFYGKFANGEIWQYKLDQPTTDDIDNFQPGRVASILPPIKQNFQFSLSNGVPTIAPLVVGNNWKLKQNTEMGYIPIGAMIVGQSGNIADNCPT